MPDAADRAKPRLCIAEEQEIFYPLYRAIFEKDFAMELLGGGLNEGHIIRAISEINADVLLVGARQLDDDTFNRLAEIRGASPGIGILLLLISCGQRAIELTRKLASVSSGGMGVFLKQSLDITDQLVGIVNSVNHGQIVLDQALSARLLTDQISCPFLEQMTAREQEILHLIANGHSNSSIANTLVIDLKTVEHHINNMYGKLKSAIDFSDKHPRVQAARIYLEAKGELAGNGKR